jgi:hypothetical protein
MDPRLMDFPTLALELLERACGLIQADFGQNLDLRLTFERWAWELNQALRLEQGGAIRRVVIHVSLENLLTIVRAYYAAYQLVNAKIALGPGIQLRREMEVLTLEAVQVDEPPEGARAGTVETLSIPFSEVPVDGASPADAGETVLISPQVVVDDEPEMTF